MKKHLLVTYTDPNLINNHVDPDFTKLLYGDSNNNGNTIKKNLEEGSFVFFNTKIGDDRYITAYFYIEKILIKGKHDAEIGGLNYCAKDVDEVFIIGSRNYSKILTTPLLFDEKLAIELTSLDMISSYFTQGYFKDRSVLSAISSKTRNPVVMSEKDKDILLNKCMYRG